MKIVQPWGSDVLLLPAPEPAPTVAPQLPVVIEQPVQAQPPASIKNNDLEKIIPENEMLTPQGLLKALKYLELNTVTKRKKIAVFRMIYPGIESALASGITRVNVVETLREIGFPISLLTFNSYIYRLRQEKGWVKSRKKIEPLQLEDSSAVQRSDYYISAEAHAVVKPTTD